MGRPARTVHAVGEALRFAGLLRETRGAGDIAVGGVCQDSRQARPGDLFLAWEGTAFDGHEFVSEAAARGAVAAVVERPLEVDVPQLVVRDGRRAAALAADAVMGRPSDDMLTVGVTGTNGKTTTALLIQHLLGPERATTVIGTLGLFEDGRVRPGTENLTTPGPVQVAVWLRELADRGTGAVIMEASSHALEQHRLDGVRFDVGVFTNLTQDHLDYHPDLEGYRSAKARLVELVRADGTIVVNRDDPAWDGLRVGPRALRTFAVDAEADVRAERLELGPEGSAFTLVVDGERRRVRSPLLGRYNVENGLAAAAAALAVGVPGDPVAERLGSAPQVSGRLEAVTTSPFTVLIDFAHTPAALDSALAVVKPLTTGRLIVLFGAGGDRDRTKRRPMAEAVRRVADVVILSSDNPRHEDPERILDDLAEGMGDTPYERRADRHEAIHLALESARPGDTVVLAGKGHETYQVIGDTKHDFDERVIVRRWLAERGAA